MHIFLLPRVISTCAYQPVSTVIWKITLLKLCGNDWISDCQYTIIIAIIIIISTIVLWRGDMHERAGTHIIWNWPNFGGIWKYDEVSKLNALRIIKFTITKSTITSWAFFCNAKVYKQSLTPDISCLAHYMLLWRQLWSHSAKSTPQHVYLKW